TYSSITKDYLGGGVSVGIFWVLDCLAGANTITAHSTLNGALFVNAHEVKPDASQVFVFDGSGFGEATATAEVVLTGNLGSFNNVYTFMCCGIDNQSFLPTVAAPA